MILSVMVASLLSSSPCTLVGRVELRRDGKTIEAGRQVALYVEKVSPKGYQGKAPALHSILQTGMQFKPGVLVVQKGDTVVFTNEDKDEHSVFSKDALPLLDFPKSRKGETGRHTFEFTGAARIQCDIHDWMRADILVVENPFFTLTESNGTFRIRDLPAGADYTLVGWEPNGNETRVAVKGCSGETTVAVVVLDEGKPRKMRRKLGGVYPVYQN